MYFTSKSNLVALFIACIFGACCASAQSTQPIDLGDRRELFIDDHLLGGLKDVQLLVHQPVPQEIAAPVSNDSSSGSGTKVRAGHFMYRAWAPWPVAP